VLCKLWIDTLVGRSDAVRARGPLVDYRLVKFRGSWTAAPGCGRCRWRPPIHARSVHE